MPTRVLMLITDLEMGGAPLDVHRLATSLDRSEFDVRVACLAGPGPVSEMLERDGVPTFACGAKVAWDVRALGRLHRLLRWERPDVLHALLFHANTAACLMGPVAGISPRRILTTVMTAEVERRWHLVVGGMTCRLCRCVIGNSPTVIEHLRRRAHVPASRLVMVPGGVDARRFADAAPLERKAIGVPSDAKLLLWVGRFDPVKGLDVLVRSVAKLDDPSVHLVLRGDGAHEPKIRRQIDEEGLGDRVRILGRRDDVPNLYAAADAFVFPSRTEGLPNALLEAMAAGLPVVTTNVPGCRDLITEEVTGLLVPYGDADLLANRIRRVLDDPALAERLGQAAREHVSEHFGLQATVRRLALLYRETVAVPSR